MIVTNPVICFGTNKKGPDEVVAKVVCLKNKKEFPKITSQILPHPQLGQICLFEYIFYIRIFNSYIVFFHHFTDCFIHEFRIKSFCFGSNFF